MLTGPDYQGTPLDRRLSAQAVRLAFRPDFQLNQAAMALAAHAAGNRTALDRALARLRTGMDGRASSVRQRAAAAVRLALTTCDRQDKAEFLAALEEEVLETFTASYEAMTDKPTPAALHPVGDLSARR